MSTEWFHLKKELRNNIGFLKYLGRPAVLLSLIVLLGAVLRFYDLGAESYWIDEMSTVIESQQSIQQLFASGRLDQPPAYYIPFHYWVENFGLTEVSTRSFSALAGIGSIMLIYLLGRELFGETVGLLGAFLLAISEFQIFFSQAARFYSFFEFFTILSFLFFILALKTNKAVHFVFYGLASVLLIYSHTYGVFILAAQNLFFVLRVKKYRTIIVHWLICQSLILLALLPYFYPLLFGKGGVRGAIDLNIGGLSTPSFLDPLRSVYRFILSARRERSWEAVLVNYAIAGALLVVGTWVYSMQQGKRNFLNLVSEWIGNLQEVPDVTDKVFLVSCWFLCPILLPFVASFVVGPMYEDHYTISAAPALYLLLAFGIFSIRKVVPIIISVTVLVIMIAPSLGVYYFTDVHEQWKEAAVYVEKNSQPGDVIVFAPNQGIGTQQRTFDWYYQGTLQGCGLGSELKESGVISTALLQCVSGHDRFWVIMRENFGEPTFDRYASFFLDPDQTNMQLVKTQHFVEISVYLFELKR